MQADEEEWVRQTVAEADRRRCAARVLSLDRKDVVAKGDNYTSELSRLRVRVVTHAGETEERTLIYKCLPSTALMRKHIAESGLFVTERRMYTEVLPLMEKIRRSKESGEPLWGQCYGAHNYESLLLEDLAVHGYKMGERMRGLDFEHCKLVMKSLAKFHALGAVLKQRGELILQDYQQHFVQKNYELMSTFYKTSFQGLAQVAETEWKGEWAPIAEKLRKKSETVLDEMIQKFSFGKERFATLNHGDCWVNNMLFKYSEDGSPVSLRFVDFQVVFYNSPAFDLVYFLSTSPTCELRPRSGEFVELYHEALDHYLERFGYSGARPSREDLMEDLERARLTGLAVSVGLLPLMKMPSKSVPDMEEFLQKFEEDPNEMEQRNTANKTEEYTAAVQYVLRESIDIGLL